MNKALQEAGSHTIQHCEPRQAREGAAVSKMLCVYGKARSLAGPFCFPQDGTVLLNNLGFNIRMAPCIR